MQYMHNNGAAGPVPVNKVIAPETLLNEQIILLEMNVLAFRQCLYLH
jgi:hypothetical protein